MTEEEYRANPKPLEPTILLYFIPNVEQVEAHYEAFAKHWEESGLSRIFGYTQTWGSSWDEWILQADSDACDRMIDRMEANGFLDDDDDSMDQSY